MAEIIHYNNPKDGNTYAIRLLDDEDEKERECFVHVIVPATETSEELELLVGSFKYPNDADKLEVEEKAKMIAYNAYYGFNNSSEGN
jgi:hypothetical protein